MEPFFIGFKVNFYRFFWDTFLMAFLIASLLTILVIFVKAPSIIMFA